MVGQYDEDDSGGRRSGGGGATQAGINFQNRAAAWVS